MRRFTLRSLIALAALTIGATQARAETAVSFAEHIAPIVHNKCTMCHRDGQSGPFELITFDDVRQHSGTIQAVVHDGYMPPWKLTNTNLDFANDRRLSDAEKALIDQWVEQGMQPGDLDSVDYPEFSSGWAFGEPDLILKMKEPFSVPASGPDVYRSFVLPNPLPEDKWVKAIELRPTARGAVHHVLFFIDETGQAVERDGEDGQPGFAGMNFLGSGQNRGRFGGFGLRGLGGYVPGATPNKLPGDLARLLPAGGDIVMQTHFHPSGKEEWEQSEMAFYFADEPPSKELVGIQLPPVFGLFAGIDVPAGKSDYEINQSFTIPIDVEAIGVGGHAHYICTEMEMTATLPNDESFTVLKIDDWDLDWQDRYQFEEPIDLPAGTQLDVRIVYDNSADNPENPNSPPKRIRWGRESNDEMGSVSLSVVAKDESERPELQAATRQLLLKQASSSSRWRERLGGFGGGGGGGQRRAGAMLQMLDRNSDGQLQESEVPEQFRDRVFGVADRNGDRVLDAQELKDAREKLGRFRN